VGLDQSKPSFCKICANRVEISSMLPVIVSTRAPLSGLYMRSTCAPPWESNSGTAWSSIAAVFIAWRILLKGTWLKGRSAAWTPSTAGRATSMRRGTAKASCSQVILGNPSRMICKGLLLSPFCTSLSFTYSRENSRLIVNSKNHTDYGSLNGRWMQFHCTRLFSPRSSYAGWCKWKAHERNCHKPRGLPDYSLDQAAP
jgi:hypothetical protein